MTRYRSYTAITPNDTALIQETAGVYVGGAGDLTVVSAGGRAATFKAVPAGTLLPIAVVTVKSTGTTATNLLALY